MTWCLAPLVVAVLLSGPPRLLVPCATLEPQGRISACSLVESPGKACQVPIPRRKPK